MSNVKFLFPERLDSALIDMCNAAYDFEPRGIYRVNSDFRFSPRNPRSNHGRGYAVDLAVTSSRQRFYVLRGLLGAGFTRVGIYPEHIHADVAPDKDKNVIWLGDYS